MAHEFNPDLQKKILLIDLIDDVNEEEYLDIIHKIKENLSINGIYKLIFNIEKQSHIPDLIALTDIAEKFPKDLMIAFTGTFMSPTYNEYNYLLYNLKVKRKKFCKNMAAAYKFLK